MDVRHGTREEYCGHGAGEELCACHGAGEEYYAHVRHGAGESIIYMSGMRLGKSIIFHVRHRVGEEYYLHVRHGAGEE